MPNDSYNAYRTGDRKPPSRAEKVDPMTSHDFVGWSPTTHPIDVSLCVGGKPSKLAAKVATSKAKSVFA